MIPGIDPVTLVSQVLFMGLALLATARGAQVRGPLGRSLSLMLWSLAIVPPLVWAVQAGLLSEVAGRLGFDLALWAHPFLMVWLVHQVRPLRLWGLVVMATVGLVGAAALLAIPPPREVGVKMGMLGIWTLLELYAGVALLRMGWQTTGVQRLRAWCAAAGSGALVLIICGFVYIGAAPEHSSAGPGTLSVLSLLAGVLWSLGFFPPRAWLRWGQLVELNELLSEEDGEPNQRKVARLESRLPTAAARMLGGAEVAIAWRGDEEQGLVWPEDWALDEDEQQALMALAASGGWAGASDDLKLPGLAERARGTDAQQIFVVPVEQAGIMEGLWVAWVPLPLLFPQDQLTLLRRMGVQVAGARQRARLEREWAALVAERRSQREREEQLRAGGEGAITLLQEALRRALSGLGPVLEGGTGSLGELVSRAGSTLQLLELLAAVLAPGRDDVQPASLGCELHRIVEAWKAKAGRTPLTLRCEVVGAHVALPAVELEAAVGVLLLSALDGQAPPERLVVQATAQGEGLVEVRVIGAAAAAGLAPALAVASTLVTRFGGRMLVAEGPAASPPLGFVLPMQAPRRGAGGAPSAAPPLRAPYAGK